VSTDRAQVALIGAGPAGLTLGRLLERSGIEAGVGERLQCEGILHGGIYLQLDAERTHVPMQELTRPRGHDLRPDGGRQGSDRRASSDRSAVGVRDTGRWDRRPGGRPACGPLSPRRRRARTAGRLRRRLRLRRVPPVRMARAALLVVDDRMLHVDPREDAYEDRVARSQLRYVCSSRAAATSLGENCVGLPFYGK
jgi:hypothetical protein